jgi:hypothetical protein
MMNANYFTAEAARDRLVGELTDAALEAAARYGVEGPSVEQELDLWHALGRVVRRQARRAGVAGPEGEQLLGELAEAAYGVALRHGFRAPFAEVELGLWRALRRAAGGLCPPAAGPRGRAGRDGGYRSPALA